VLGRPHARAILPCLLACVALALAVPALAAAATYEVNTAVDQEDANLGDGTCETENGGCTLRAAIVEVNFSADAANTIEFDPVVFNGQEEDTIFLSSPLQTIFKPVAIEAGSSCMTADVDGAPCAGVVGTGTDPVLAIEADDSTVSGLAITAGSIGIGVFGASTGFTATGNWIGIPMSGTNSGNSTGIFIGPGSDGAQIGGPETVDRNVIAHNELGLDIEGASGATVLGNRFGQPGGGLDPEPQATNIEITNLKPVVGEELQAEDNEIGAVVDQAAQQTDPCDGGCNVISSATGKGIDLVGNLDQEEAPASGPTTIRGNYVGLNPAGTAAVDNVSYRGNGQHGILAGAADDVTVGGPQAGAANFVAGGEHGIYGKDGDDLFVSANVIGIAPTGDVVAPPSRTGISALALNLDDPLAGGPIVASNSVRMGEDGVGIENWFGKATIVTNALEGGENGILTRGEADGSLIAGNSVEASDDTGIVLRNPGNEVLGNEVLDSGSGIEVDPGAEVDVSGNVIGGDTAEDENVISGSDGFAIVVRGIEESRNEVRRNRGSGNEGEADFIVLRPWEDGGDPNGVKRPTITGAGKTETSGKAQPGALVRVFRKASNEEGELAGFVAEAVANGSGEWKTTYAALPEGTILTATQTLAGGTSELSATVTTPPDPPAPPPSGCPAVPSACPPAAPSATTPAPPPDTTKPKVTIKKAPKPNSTSTTAKFVFSANEKSTFKCKLDKKAWAKCKSPKKYKKLKPGKHVFKVKATDTAGSVSKVLTRKFTVGE
jgi:CSLREA domain-containing protein